MCVFHTRTSLPDSVPLSHFRFVRCIVLRAFCVGPLPIAIMTLMWGDVYKHIIQDQQLLQILVPVTVGTPPPPCSRRSTYTHPSPTCTDA